MTSASASRVTRSSRSLRFAALLFIAVASVVTVLRAQESPPRTETAARPATPASPAPEAAGAPDAAPASAPAELPGDAADRAAPTGTPPARFEPTEKVRADFDVSFPIDI